MAVGYDNLAINHQILLDLPFREGTGAVTYDVAKPDRVVTLVNTPTWTSVASGLGVLELNGANEYLECDTLDTADLDFTTGDYSIACWVNWTDTGDSEMIIARYELDVSGWEVYFYNSILQLRHHHALGASVRTGAYSYNWTPGTWWLMGISKSGAYPLHYRNGIPVTMGYSAGGMEDPETCPQDLVIGCRFTKNDDWYQGMKWRPRVWDRELSATDHRMLFELERHWFGV